MHGKSLTPSNRRSSTPKTQDNEKLVLDIDPAIFRICTRASQGSPTGR